MRFGREDYDRRIIDTDNKIPQDEPCFFLRGKDVLAPALLLEWAKQLRLSGGDPNMASNAEEHAQLMIDWQRKHGGKTPDMYESVDRKQWLVELKEVLKQKEPNFNRVKVLFENIFGSLDKLYLFTSEEIEIPTENLEDLTSYCFRIDDRDKYSKCKLALFMKKGFWKVIKNEL